MNKLQECLDLYFKQGDVNNIAVRVGDREKVFHEVYRYDKKPIDSFTLFDMASVTKIMSTTTLALIAIDKNLFGVEDKVSRYFSVPDDKKNLAMKNLLTHTMGIGYKYLYADGVNYDNIQNHILTIPSDIEIGTNVLYSCPGYILLGKIIEKVFDAGLDELFIEKVAKPLGMENTSFLPSKDNSFVNANQKEKECGTVNDENCAFLGGVAGNAGLFSDMKDVCKYVKMLLNYGTPLISRKTFSEAIKNHTPSMSASRGLGFLYVDEKYKQTGKLFPKGSIGHCGHTGQSIFADLNSGLYTIILSDATKTVTDKYGYGSYGKVMKMREDIHNAIYEDLQGIL